MKLSDEQVREAMSALRERRVPLTGQRVRAELRQRFGAAGGTGRIFRMLTEPPPPSPPIIDALQRELSASLARELAARERADVALARAELAEERERAHQDTWAREIDTLRLQLRAARRTLAVREP